MGGDYEVEAELRLADLHERVHGGSYRSQPSRRTYIPKADGRRRPLAITALEDKIVQGAVAMVLSAIYEEDFLGFSYEFRPERGPRDALDVLAMAINSRKVNYNILATFAEFEADLIRLRTREGMAIAKARGRLRGKQPKLSDKQQKELRRMHDTGTYAISDLAELFSVSRPTVYRTLARQPSPS